MDLEIILLGRMEYGRALKLQEERWEIVSRCEARDALFLVEHPPVITLGIRGKEENILISKDERLKAGVTVFNVNRGGDVTSHGPGQIVGYPVMNLNRYGRDIHAFVNSIEHTIISLLSGEYDIHAYKGEKKYTGVWVGDEKIAAIGIQVKRWISMHGFAFNVNTDLTHFNWIVPCGITDKGVTSLQKLTGLIQDMNRVVELTVKYFCREFGLNPLYASYPGLNDSFTTLS